MPWGELRALVCSWIAPCGPKARDRNPLVQMVNYLAQRGVPIATAELQMKLEQLKKAAGKLRAPAPRHIPRTEDLQTWLDRVGEVDPLRRWVMAMIATYGLRGHEVWHIDRLPGEVSADPGVIEVGSFQSRGDGSETKTGHRFALPLPQGSTTCAMPGRCVPRPPRPGPPP